MSGVLGLDNMLRRLLWFLLAPTAIASVAITVAAVIDDEIPDPTTASLLRGGQVVVGDGSHGKNRDTRHDAEAWRRLLPSPNKNAAPTSVPSATVAVNYTGSSPWNRWHDEWSSLQASDLRAMAYDASFLGEENHRTWGAAYLGGRRTVLDVKEEGRVGEGGATAAAAEGSGGMASLRGGTASNNQNDSHGDTNHGKESEKSQQQTRHLQWMVHGPDHIDPIGVGSNEKVDSNEETMYFTDIAAHGATADATAAADGTDETPEEAHLLQRLANAVKVTKELNAEHKRVDTNSQYTYSNPPHINSPSNPKKNNNMQQFSQASGTSARQRLLTGSYAAWQWYDRSNLASPLNLKLEKVSRINYAFFQTDDDVSYCSRFSHSG